jgi:hypothetical protein
VIVADVINAKVGDTIDDVPVIAGAFVDPAAADVPGADSAAERAARMSRPPPADTSTPKARRTKRSWKPWLLAIGLVLVLVAALGGTYAWTQTQFFVGRAGADVAIFRGVNTEFGPLKFFNIYKITDLPVADLNPSVRTQINDGITASGEREAENIVRNLRDQVLPACRPEATITPSPTPTPTRTPTPTPTPKKTVAGKATARTTPARRSVASSSASTSKIVSLPVPSSPQPTCPVP